MIVVAGIILVSAIPAGSDTIVLKDGTRETSKRVWESERYVHFILSGTQSVEIRFAKEIVERIEHDGISAPKKVSAPESREQKQEEASQLPVSPPTKQIDNEGNASASMSLDDATLIKGNRGIQFYDPRRKQRYWITRDAHYDNLADAINAMADRYKRSVHWVERNMGEENDLAEIHRNLLRTLRREESSEKKDVIANHQADLMDENDPGETLPEKANKSTPVISSPPGNVQLNSRGIHFYDPRRKDKYWSSQKMHHQSFEGAVEALATQYGVTPEWVKDHIGDTNDLEQIHKNLRNAINGR